MATSKIQSAKVGLITGWTADAVAGPVADQYEVVPALEGPDGGHYVEYAPSFLDVSDRELVLTKDCENPEKLLQYADQFYDDEVSLQTYYGSIPDQIKKMTMALMKFWFPPMEVHWILPPGLIPCVILVPSI